MLRTSPVLHEIRVEVIQHLTFFLVIHSHNQITFIRCSSRIERLHSSKDCGTSTRVGIVIEARHGSTTRVIICRLVFPCKEVLDASAFIVTSVSSGAKTSTKLLTIIPSIK